MRGLKVLPKIELHGNAPAHRGYEIVPRGAFAALQKHVVSSATLDRLDVGQPLPQRALMRGLRRNIHARQLLLALYVLAMSTLGFAHKPLQASEAQDLSAYALPDGTLPDLCLTGGGDGSKAPARASATCQACLLISAPGLAANCSPDLTEPARHSDDVAIPIERIRIERAKPANTRSRAPPDAHA